MGGGRRNSMLSWSEFCFLLIFNFDINTVTMITPYQKRSYFSKKESKNDERGQARYLLCFSLTTVNQPGYITGSTRSLHGHDVTIAAVVQAGM